jgi:hypothetical protein
MQQEPEDGETVEAAALEKPDREEPEQLNREANPSASRAAVVTEMQEDSRTVAEPQSQAVTEHNRE